jgi:hypothetical protein
MKMVSTLTSTSEACRNRRSFKSRRGLRLMEIHHDLLAVARDLVEKDFPTEGTLRRSVSTAYYALFHLLIHEACSNWARPRVFKHKRMFAASDKRRAKHKDAAENSTEQHLFEVTLSFVQLQQNMSLPTMITVSNCRSIRLG